MVAVDTNIIVRFLTQDDELQFQKSIKIFQTQNVFIPDTVILETEWVLRFAYKFKPVEICEALKKLFGLPNVYLNNANLVAQSLQWHELGLDFADASHLAHSQNHTQFYTFDEKFIKKAKGLTDCKVQQP
ncbi:MAG: type II toxin-antitoxin system VapC family toxin [Richelia sp. RM2_1_2]|nr:type II toxin-antitoxin system VapC family toxin [Richelia sp. SM1_7_0]NJN11032.1 type II toxin-antitoxin system VapC family toxin [Richelia sp. RM1_1_1]NJO31537.1 type II toxin-antitoxin system VapC family toxin [Richelia sp. SL_2_1]NJO62085.1 type II toxin-antitoxin system VapC family toxin [Richelia sp. RM2_1_2]